MDRSRLAAEIQPPPVGMRVDGSRTMPKSASRPPASDSEFDRSSIETQPPASTSYSSSATGSYDRDRVAMRAYELYMARGGGDGADLEDWLVAEREISNRASDTRRK